MDKHIKIIGTGSKPETIIEEREHRASSLSINDDIRILT
jgi:hypothetical protein